MQRFFLMGFLVTTLVLVGCQNGAQGDTDHEKKTADTGASSAEGGGAVAGLNTDEDKAFYSLGVQLGTNISVFAVSESELALVQQGLADAAMGKEPKIEVNDSRNKLNSMVKERTAKVASKEKERGKAFADKIAAEDGATQTDSGMVIKHLTEGTGPMPAATDKVKVHYVGKLIDGTEFDSSVARGTPAEFGLNGVVKCWKEGLQLIKVGGKAQLICPSDIAYGDRGRPPKIPAGATLVFDVELLEIVSAAK